MLSCLMISIRNFRLIAQTIRHYVPQRILKRTQRKLFSFCWETLNTKKQLNMLDSLDLFDLECCINTQSILMPV